MLDPMAHRPLAISNALLLTLFLAGATSQTLPTTQPMKPNLKWPNLASYETEIKEPGVLLESDHLWLFAPKVKAKEANAIPYDVPKVELTHDGPLCSFDAFIKKYKLKDPALEHLAEIVRAADTDTLENSAQASGLLAITLGLSHNIADDHEMLKVGMTIYDALYSWCKTMVNERHGWNPEKIKM